MPAHSVAQVARLLDELELPGVKADAGPGCCAYASGLAVVAFNELGIEADVMPVSVLVYPTLFAEDVDLPSSEEPTLQELRRSFPVFALGAFNDAARPVAGGTKLPGFTVAAHMVAAVADPPTLVDFTIDQLNRLPAAAAHGLRLPSRVIRRFRDEPPMPLGKAEVFPAPGWTARYHHMPEEVSNLPAGWKPERRHVARVVDEIRQRLASPNR